jgi:hypothetical protein
MEFIIRNFPVKIKAENFKNKNLFRKELNEYDKKLITSIVKECVEENIRGESEYANDLLIHFKDLFQSNGKITYEDLMKTFSAENNDVMLAYLMLAFKKWDSNITLQLYYVYGRLSPLPQRNEWLDNFRLKALMQILALSKYGKDDTPYTYSIENEKPLPINKNVSINFSKVARIIIGDLKRFIIKTRMYPFYSANKSETPLQNITDEQLCDDCYKYFPFYSGDSHGCDAFYNGMTLTIDEITEFLERYPSAILGYILNTATYASGRGEHWLALVFIKHNAIMLCSQASDFGVFHDNGRLRGDLERHGYGLAYNARNIQTDGYNCGLFSLLSLIMFVNNFCIKDSIDEAIKMTIDLIGKDAKKIEHGDIEKLRDRLLGEKTW